MYLERVLEKQLVDDFDASKIAKELTLSSTGLEVSVLML